MAKPFHCTVVTPEAEAYDGEVTYANLPAHDGQQGVMAGRAPMVVALGTGRLDLTLDNGSHTKFDLQGGFAQMVDNKLTLLSEKATEV